MNATSRCPRCLGAIGRQDRAGVWFCPSCGHEFEPYCIDPMTTIREFTGAGCPATGRAHRIAGDRCIDCHQEA